VAPQGAHHEAGSERVRLLRGDEGHVDVAAAAQPRHDAKHRDGHQQHGERAGQAQGDGEAAENAAHGGLGALFRIGLHSHRHPDAQRDEQRQCHPDQPRDIGRHRAGQRHEGEHECRHLGRDDPEEEQGPGRRRRHQHRERGLARAPHAAEEGDHRPVEQGGEYPAQRP
jgi:hypothetical protein